jgi:hypothetical protein
MESRGNIEKSEADIAIRRVPEQKHSTRRQEFFTQVSGVAAVTLASAPVPVISLWRRSPSALSVPRITSRDPPRCGAPGHI